MSIAGLGLNEQIQGGKGKFSPQSLAQQQEAIDKIYQEASEKDFLCFMRGLVIDSQSGPQVFENCIVDFQRETFADIAPSLHALRDGKMPPKRRHWWERTKKASKDADLAIVAIWLVAFPRRPFYGEIGAADLEQAAIVKERISHLLHWNPWLSNFMELVGNDIRSIKKSHSGKPMSCIKVVAADTAGSHGGTPDLLIVNELSHITKQEFVKNVMDNADGVAQGIVIVATNAGVLGSMAHVWRLAAMSDPSWSCHILSKPAPWHTQETLRQAEKRDRGGSRYLRLWWGVWVSGVGDALSEKAIDSAFRLPGPTTNPMFEWIILQSLDLGVKHDHCGFVTIGVNRKLKRIRLFNMRRWEPSPKTGEVFLPEVKNVVLGAFKHYASWKLVLDPHQAILMKQELQLEGVICQEASFGGSDQVAMADALLQTLNNGILELYDDPSGHLRADLGKMNIVEKPYGYRLEAVSDETGHADVGVALAMVLPFAVELLGGMSIVMDDGFVFAETTPTVLTDTEMEHLPSHFQELFSDEEEKPHRRRKRRRKVPYDGLE